MRPTPRDFPFLQTSRFPVQGTWGSRKEKILRDGFTGKRSTVPDVTQVEGTPVNTRVRSRLLPVDTDSAPVPTSSLYVGAHRCEYTLRGTMLLVHPYRSLPLTRRLVPGGGYRTGLGSSVILVQSIGPWTDPDTQTKGKGKSQGESSGFSGEDHGHYNTVWHSV